MNHYSFRAEFPDSKNGKTKTKVIHIISKSLAGAMRKAYQSYDSINVISIID